MRNDIHKMLNTPFAYVKANMVSWTFSFLYDSLEFDSLRLQSKGDHEPSYVANLLQLEEAERVDEDLIKKSAAVGYGAGSETVNDMLPKPCKQTLTALSM